MEESLVESKMNVILDSGLFSKVIVVRSTVPIRIMIREVPKKMFLGMFPKPVGPPPTLVLLGIKM